MEDYVSKYGFIKKIIKQDDSEQIIFYIKGYEEPKKT